MGILDKVLGKKPTPPAPSVTDIAPPETDPTNDPEAPPAVAEIAATPEPDREPESLSPAPAPEPSQTGKVLHMPAPPTQPETPTLPGIRALDVDGREVTVPREEWRTNVLPAMLQQVLNDPGQLSLLILNSLNEGFAAEVAGAAEHLYRTDPVLPRGASIWSIVLMQTERLDQAEQVLDRYIAQHGAEGNVLNNLARLYATRGDSERAESTLWLALETEPNLDQGLAWYVSLAAGRGGDPAAKAALEQLRALPGSWRPQLWLARAELAQNRPELARPLYEEALTRAPRPVPGELLMQLSGDLGAAGRLDDLIAFTAPHFDPAAHGLPVGNNLIKAHMDTGNPSAAQSIVTTLAAFNRPDWRPGLDFWTAQLNALGNPQSMSPRQTGPQPVPAPSQQPQQEIQVGMLRLDGAIWLPPQSPAALIFGRKALDGPTVSFLGGTAEAPADPATAQSRADLLGRMTRALPLFLAEQVELLGRATARTMLPWAVAQGPGQASGFVVSGQPWPDEVVVQSAGPAPDRADYSVSVHIDAEIEPWTASLAFLRTSDGVRIGELDRDFDPGAPEPGLRALAQEVLDLLGESPRQDPTTVYELPTGPSFTSYLSRLEQLLAVRCAAMEGVQPGFLSDGPALIESTLSLAESEPQNTAVRLLALETGMALARVRPDLGPPFAQRLEALTQTHPIANLNIVFN